MKYNKIYIKQAETHVAGHVFELVVVNFIQKQLLDSGYLKLLDYRLWAYTDDGIVQIRFETQHQTALVEFEKSIQLVEVSEESVRIALEQVSCEHQRLPNFKMTDLLEEVKKTNSIKWVEYDDYSHSAPIQKQALILASKSGKFGRKSPKDFREYTLVYEIKDCPFNLKPLAVYVILALALNQIIKLYKKTGGCYDFSDEWAEYQKLVGYAHYLRVPEKSHPILDNLQKTELAHRKEILGHNFIEKLNNYIQHQTLTDNHYFRLSEMYAYSHQYIGKSGWKEINTKDNIQTVLRLLTVKVEKSI